MGAASPIEALEARRLLSVVAPPGTSAVSATAAGIHRPGRAAAPPAITGSALPTNMVYVDVPFFGPLAEFAGVPPVVPGDPASDDPSVRINWGDGTPATVIPAAKVAAGLSPAGTYAAGAPHVYSSAGSFNASVLFFEGKTLQARVKQQVFVDTHSAGGVATDATVDQSFGGIIGTFFGFGQMVASDVNGGIAIDWGDGQTSAATVSSPGAGEYEVSGIHTYSTPGTHPVQFSASFNAAGSAATQTESVNSTIVVHRHTGSARPPPVVGSYFLTPGDAGIVAGETGSVAEIDPSFTGVTYEQAAVSQYTATVQFTGHAAQPLTPLSFDDTGALEMTTDAPTFAKPGAYAALDPALQGRAADRPTAGADPSNPQFDARRLGIGHPPRRDGPDDRRARRPGVFARLGLLHRRFRRRRGG